MKYLLQAIQAQRASIPLSDIELRQLIADVQKGRDSREEFLESIERVLSELRGYTEHSTAFLQKVAKRDAPDYYDVIKNPMDLGTMARKIKAGAYRNKRQFAHDLDLIWDNCLVYNSDPTHPLRRNVHFMRKKATHLLNYVHDKNDVSDALREWEAVQRSWATTNADAITAAAESGGALVPNEAALELRRSLPSADIPFEQRPALLRDPHGMSAFATLNDALTAFDDRSFAPVENEAGPSRLSANGSATKASNTPVMEEDALLVTLKTIRMEGPLHLALTTIRKPAEDASNAEDTRLAPIPSSSSSGSMSPGANKAFLGSTKVNGAAHAGGLSSVKEQKQPLTASIASPFDAEEQPVAGPSSPRAERRSTAAAVLRSEILGSWWDSVVSDDLLANGAPALPTSEHISAAEREALMARLVSRQRAAKRRWNAREEEPPRKPKRLRNQIPQTIKALQKLRAVHLKLGALAQANSSNESPPAWALQESEEEDEDEGEGSAVDETDPSRHPRPATEEQLATAAALGSQKRNPITRMEPAKAKEAMEHVAKLLMLHHGLQGSNKGPVEVIANMGMQLISNLGRSLRGYSDRHGQSMPPAQIIKHSLQEVANTDIPSLEGYVKQSVERQNSRVNDLLRRVKAAYESQIQHTTDRQAVHHEALFQEGGDGLMAGSLAGEIGEDFFGFKELGLDGLSVPLSLLKGRGKSVPGDLASVTLANAGAMPALAGKSSAELVPFPPPPSFVLLDSGGVSAQIGLLQGLFREKLREHKRNKSRSLEAVSAEEMEMMPDDDEMTLPPEGKPKIKVPPTGKLPQRAMWTAKRETKAAPPARGKGAPKGAKSSV